MRRNALFAMVLVIVTFGALAVPASVQGSPPASGVAQGAQTATVTAAALNVRGGPGVGYARVGLLRRGAVVTIIGRQGSWLQVSYPGGQGWISVNFVRMGGTATAGAPAPATGAPTTPGNSGGKLVFRTASGGPIYTVNADGSNLKQVGTGIDPVWSPDGSRIAYVDWVVPRGLYVMNADGSNKTRLFDWNLIRRPDWSPDGKEIVFSMQKGGRLEETQACFFGFCFDMPADPYWKLGIVTVADSQLREPKGDNWKSYNPQFRADGTLVYDNGAGLYAAYANKDEIPFPLNTDSSLTDPNLCAATGQLAVSYRQHDHLEIYTLNGNGGALRQLTTFDPLARGKRANNAAPSWSPDCAQILFLSDRDGRWRPYIMNPDGSNQRPFLPAVMDGLVFDYGFAGDKVFDWAQ